MTDIETKALALVNEVSDKHTDAESIYEVHRPSALRAALCRAIEHHEAFKQEVSDAVGYFFGLYDIPSVFQHFIIPAPKPDPLVEVIEAWFNDFRQEVSDAASFRTALEAYGLEIREKNDG